MYCRVIACDFDGTGAINDHPAPELYATLAAARACGIVTLLLTGWVLEDGQLIFNRGALMLLPSGINKGVGVRRALNELGRSERNLIARHRRAQPSIARRFSPIF